MYQQCTEQQYRAVLVIIAAVRATWRFVRELCQMSRLVVTVVRVKCVLPRDVWRPVECRPNGTEVTPLLPGTCGNRRQEGSSIVCQAAASKYPALEMLILWLVLRFVYWIYGDFIQWADRPTGLTDRLGWQEKLLTCICHEMFWNVVGDILCGKTNWLTSSK